MKAGAEKQLSANASYENLIKRFESLSSIGNGHETLFTRPHSGTQGRTATGQSAPNLSLPLFYKKTGRGDRPRALPRLRIQFGNRGTLSRSTHATMLRKQFFCLEEYLGA